MKFLLIFTLFINSLLIFSQEEEEIPVNKTELGLDCFANASTLGGSFGLGLKYGIIKNKNIKASPKFNLSFLKPTCKKPKRKLTISEKQT